MTTVQEILSQLEAYGDEKTKKTLTKHGAKEPFFGVKVADLKKILKKTKKNHDLSLGLYQTGNSDAMYLAGLMADEHQISKEQLNEWVEQAYWSYLSEYTVPWVAAETKYGFELGLEWITSKKENIASAGWSTLAYYSAVNKDEDLDLEKYRELLDSIDNQIHQAQNRVKYTMNGFVISVGTHVKALTEQAKIVAEKIGKITVDMNGTACKVPFAKDYIKKAEDKNRVGKKRKTARC
jgi:3-methyladenine DNA glycosylase AlkD